MSINSTLIVQLIVFLILVWFTMKFVWPPIAKALDERAEKIRQGLEAADKAKLELQVANKQVEQELEQARKEVSAQLAAAEKRANSMIDEAKNRAQAEANKIIVQAEEEAYRAVVKAREELKEQVAVLAVKGAEQILHREIDAQAHAEILNRLKLEL